MSEDYAATTYGPLGHPRPGDTVALDLSDRTRAVVQYEDQPYEYELRVRGHCRQAGENLLENPGVTGLWYSVTITEGAMKGYTQLWWNPIVIYRPATHPEHWPPQPGEVWRGEDGQLWFAVRHAAGGTRLISPTDESYAMTDEFVSRHSPVRVWSPGV